VTGRVGAGGKAAGVAADQVVRSLKLDAAVTRRPDHDIIACGETGFAKHAHWDRHLVLAGDSTHAFTILARR